MKAKYTLLVLVLATSTALAADAFSARVHRAKVIEDLPSGKAYQAVLWQYVGRYTATVMTQCFPEGTRPDTTSFTMVANVLPDHTLSRIEVRPETKMSKCFLNGFKDAPFPVPPKEFGQRGMPIEIDMTVKP